MSLSTDRDKFQATDKPTLYKQIRLDIERRILTGEWPPGHRIPFEHQLMTRYGCSRMTVSKALTELAQADLIERRRRAGTFVRRPRSNRPARGCSTMSRGRRPNIRSARSWPTRRPQRHWTLRSARPAS
jgi:DNA-binding GntR family transcriptional regulator